MGKKTHTLVDSGLPSDTFKWLKKYGYRGLTTAIAGQAGGLIFCRPNEPATLAVVGDTLKYDKHTRLVRVVEGE